MKLQYLDQPDEPVSVDALSAEGVFYLFIDTTSGAAWKEPLDRLCAERGYKNRDEVFFI